jgi:hypothetical protein
MVRFHNPHLYLYFKSYFYPESEGFRVSSNSSLFAKREGLEKKEGKRERKN